MLRVLPKAVIGTGLALLLFSGAALAYLQAVSQPEGETLPHSIAGVGLVETLYGGEAVEAINRMHLGDSDLSSAAIGWYGLGSQITLYVSSAPLALLAENMAQGMEDKIRTGDTPFAWEGAVEHGGKRVVQMTGLGQSHFLYRQGRLVIWLAADQALAQTALAETIAFYAIR